MTDIEKQALALVNEVRAEYLREPAVIGAIQRDFIFIAFCRALKMLNAEREAHAATKRDMSDAVESRWANICSVGCQDVFARFIIKPPVDPLKDALAEAVNTMSSGDKLHEALRAALAARGGRIVFDGGE